MQIIKQVKTIALGLALSLAGWSVNAEVIEIATFKLKEGVSAQQFAPLDKAVEVDHVSQQPGFLSRETAYSEDGVWLVVVHWASIEDADASMNSFMGAPAAANFMSHLDAETMSMKRYQK